MPRRIKIQMEGRLSLDELESRYRGAKNPIDRTHYQIIWLLAQGRPTEEVASLTGYSRSWIYELVWGYNKTGVETLGDHRKDHPGAPPLLSDEQRAALREYVQERRAEGDRVNGAHVADWMGKVLGRTISRQRGWEYLKALNSRTTKERKQPIDRQGKRIRRSTRQGLSVVAQREGC